MGYRISPTFHDAFFAHPFFDLHRELRSSSSRDCQSGSCPPTLVPRYTRRSSSYAAYFEIELPGVQKEHVHVEVEGNVLVVKGKRFRTERGSCALQHREVKKKEEEEETVKIPVVAEKYYLAYRLGSRVDLEGIKADHCGNGILVVTVPVEARKVRKIAVSNS